VLLISSPDMRTIDRASPLPFYYQLKQILMNDITELQPADEVLRQIEERFRRLVELMPVAVYVCDASGIIQSYNRRCVELWGQEPTPGDSAQRYCGSLQLYSPDGQWVPHAESAMAEVLRTGIEARDLEVMIERLDGSRITVLVNIVPLRNARGGLTGAMNCFQDITERKQAQKNLQHSYDQWRALAGRLEIVREEERKRVAREIHDQLGQALTAIKIDVSSLIHERAPDQEQSASLLRLIDETIRSVRLVGDAGDADSGPAASSGRIQCQAHGDTDDGEAGRTRRGL